MAAVRLFLMPLRLIIKLPKVTMIVTWPGANITARVNVLF